MINLGIIDIDSHYQSFVEFGSRFGVIEPHFYFLRLVWIPDGNVILAINPFQQTITEKSQDGLDQLDFKKES